MTPLSPSLQKALGKFASKPAMLRYFAMEYAKMLGIIKPEIFYLKWKQDRKIEKACELSEEDLDKYIDSFSVSIERKTP